jgi:ATP-dependent Lon protease
MTGEITLRGAVLAVGGIKEKLIAAKQGGVRVVVLPRANEPDVGEIEPRVLRGLKLVFVDTLDEAIEAVLGRSEPATRKGGKRVT